MRAIKYRTGRDLMGRCAGGFSLVELLVVIGIMVLLGAATIPAFTDMMRSSRLTAASRQLMDELGYARQTALSKNVPVEVRIYKLPKHNDVAGTPVAWRGFQAFEMGPAGERATGNAQFFPNPVIMDPDPQHSAILGLTEQTPTQD